jgi:hypothetical protein
MQSEGILTLTLENIMKEKTTKEVAVDLTLELVFGIGIMLFHLRGAIVIAVFIWAFVTFGLKGE